MARVCSIVCVALIGVSACGVAETTTTLSPTTLPPTTGSTPEPIVEVRHGTVEGRGWTMRSWIDAGTGSLCSSLRWDVESDGWENCYSLGSYPGDLVWTNPTPPSTQGGPMVFVVGLAPLDTATVEVRRGDVVMGTTSDLGVDTLSLGKLGFALPLTVSDLESLGPTAALPGLDEPYRVGTLAPLEVLALGADGVELARRGVILGQSVWMTCLVPPGAVVAYDFPCAELGAAPLASFIDCSNVGGSTVAWVIAGPTAAVVEMHQGDVRLEQPATLVPQPAFLQIAPTAVAAFPVDIQRLGSVEFVVRDSSGATVAEFSLSDFIGGGEGAIPGSL